VAAVWARARAELRSGWRRAVGLALLIGLAGGAAIAAAIGARRTDSALDRFNRKQRAADVLLVDDGTLPYRADADRVSSMGVVAAVARAHYPYILGNEGILAAADSSLGQAVDRPKVLHGRLPHPDRANEVTVGFDLAKRRHLHVGSSFPVVDVNNYPAAAEFVAAHPEAQLHLTVVGIVAVPGELPPRQPGNVTVHGTPALYRFLAANEGVAATQAHHPSETAPRDSLLVRLKGGEVAVPAFHRSIQDTAGNVPVVLLTREVLDGGGQRSIHLQTQALWLLAGLLTLSAALVFGQTLSRLITLEASDGTRLRALGMTRGQLWAVGMTRIAAAAALATAVAVGTAIALSPLTPIGLARSIEPQLGVHVDLVGLGVGAVLVMVMVSLLSAFPAWHASKATVADADVAGARPSFVAGGLTRAGFPLTIVAGTRMALEPGRGRTAVPVHSTVLGATLGIAALVAALTFGTSLAHLLDTPRLYGAVWDTRLTNYGGAGEHKDPDLAKHLAAVAHRPGVAAVAAATLGHTQLGGRETGLMVVQGALRPPIVDGRYPAADSDIALGAKTMRRIHTRIGSTIRVTGPAGREFPFRVVGRAVLPADADPRLGEGMVFSQSGLQRVLEGVDISNFPTGADSLFIRFTPGADRAAVVDDLQHLLGPLVTDAGVLDVLPPGKPTDLVNFGGVQGLPFVLAGILAVLAVATLTHLLASAVRRRRRDLAILKTLGFSRGQVTAAVLWQATTLVAIALLVGIPVGVGVGRWLWAFFATQQGVVVDPRIPLLAVLLVIPATIALAEFVAALPARAAGLTKPALVLRAE
jgi:hypothetical protein